MKLTHLLLSISLALAMLRPAPAVRAGALPSTAAGNACVVIVQDESGSMDGNDPTYLRNTGAKLLISLLDDGDRIGLLRFSTTSRPLTSGLVTINGPQDKVALLSLLTDTPPGGYTDIAAALADAAALLQTAPDCDARFIVLLSDGNPELPGGLPSDYNARALEAVRRASAPVLGIALTTGGESPLMFELASALPGGAVIPAHSAEDLLDAYLEVVSRLKDRTVFGSGFSAAPGPAPLPVRPELAQYVSRATFILGKSDTVAASLIGPDGQPVAPDSAGVTFFFDADPRFAVITVETPAPGGWSFALTGSGRAQARAILRSRLRVAVDRPEHYQPQGETMLIAARLIEEDLSGAVTTLIGEASFSARILRPDGSQDALDLLYDDGTHGDAQAGDGVFSNEYVKTDLVGEYALEFLGHKGVIPVTHEYHVLVIPFPQPIVLQPAVPSVEVRGESVSLLLRLEGGDPPVLDRGEFDAHITTPDGSVQVFPLLHTLDGFAGRFAPAQDGPYLIEFIPRDAVYKGMPYALSAERAIQVRLIPVLNLTTEAVDQAGIEAQALRSGVTFPLKFISSSPQAETVTVELAGIPDLAIKGMVPDSLPAGETQAYLTVYGNLKPGTYAGQLILSARDGLDLARREVPFSLEVYQPALTFTPESLDAGELRLDQQSKGTRLTVNISSSSRVTETIALTLEGQPGLRLEAEPVTIPAKGQAEVSLHLWGDGLEPGTVSGQIRIAARDGVQVSPATIPVAFTLVIPSFCERWCWPLGGSGILLIVAAAVAGSILSSRPRPWGSLRPVKVPAGVTPASVTLAGAASFFHPDQVLIGDRAKAGVRLRGGGVRARHAAIRLTETTVTERAGRPPKPIKVRRRVNVVQNLSGGLVRVGNVSLAKGETSQPLRPGTRLHLGEYEFEYRE